jgi:hypothetical protein
MTKKIRPKSKKQNLVEQEVDGELLIYDLERNKAFCLNQTSMLVWQSCDGTRTIADINDLLGKQLKSQVDEDVVWLALDQLSKEKLIDPPLGLGSKYENVSRRDVMKKIAVGSAVALPIVAGLVAPPATLAQTACATVCTCNAQGPYAQGAVCGTTGLGTPCPAAPAGCTVCRADAAVPAGMTGAGMCFTS